MMTPFTRARSSSVSSITVPSSDANTPPKLMSPTSTTGASADSAIDIFTMSPARKLISAGLPAPSMTTQSTVDSSASYVALMRSRRAGL